MTDILLRTSILKDQILDLAAFAKESSGIIDQLQTEIKALRAENERLRSIEAAASDYSRLCDLIRDDYAEQSSQTFESLRAALAAKDNK